ncbi:unnamed protein product, partial [Adineta steineri]
YFVLEYYPSDLDRVIKLKRQKIFTEEQRQKTFTEKQIKRIIGSLLRGLKFMHSAGIIHRDLKPSNIGIDNNTNVAILDFGLSRALSNGIKTGYVATRWWRAPEVYVNWGRYNDRLDIWSVGCIMAELIQLKPIFPGTDHIDLLNRIFNIIGTPDLATLNGTYTEEEINYIGGFLPRTKIDFNQKFGFKYQPAEADPISDVSPLAIELLDRLLTFDPRKRPTAEEALAHPFFSDWYDSMDEPSMEPVIDEHQDANHSTAQWKSLIWSMIENFQPPDWIDQDIDGDME